MSAVAFDQARSAGEAFLGFEISWDLGDHADTIRIPRPRFAKIFEGLVEAPAAPTAEDSLPLACRIGWGPRIGVNSKLVNVQRQSRPDKGTPLAFAVYYRVSAEGEKDRWEIGARVRIEGDQAVVRPPVEGDMNELAEKWAQRCAEFANDRREYAFNADVSHLLVQAGAKLGWVSRREAGGVYFLPGDTGREFMRVLDDLEAECVQLGRRSAFVGHATPQFADPRTLKTWASRTESQFETHIEELATELEEFQARDNVRVSSFDLRAARCLELAEQAKRYSQVLREKLDPVLTQCDMLHSRFLAAKEQTEAARAKVNKVFAELGVV